MKRETQKRRLTFYKQRWGETMPLASHQEQRSVIPDPAHWSASCVGIGQRAGLRALPLLRASHFVPIWIGSCPFWTEKSIFARSSVFYFGPLASILPSLVLFRMPPLALKVESTVGLIRVIGTNSYLSYIRIVSCTPTLL